MGLIGEIRKRSGAVAAPAICVCTLAYMAHHAVNSERGIRGWRALTDQIAELKVEASAVAQTRDVWASRVRLVHPESLDPDMLDEYSRRVLNVGRPQEVVVFTEPSSDRSR